MRAFCVTWERRAVGNGCFLLFWWVLNAERQTVLNALFLLERLRKTQAQVRKRDISRIGDLGTHWGQGRRNKKLCNIKKNSVLDGELNEEI